MTVSCWPTSRCVPDFDEDDEISAREFEAAWKKAKPPATRCNPRLRLAPSLARRCKICNVRLHFTVTAPSHEDSHPCGRLAAHRSPLKLSHSPPMPRSPSAGAPARRRPAQCAPGADFWTCSARTRSKTATCLAQLGTARADARHPAHRNPAGAESGKVSFRAFNGEGYLNAIKTLIDGIPSNVNSGNQRFIDMLFPLDISYIEVVRGTNDPRYGLHNIGGNVNFGTRQGGSYTDARLATAATTPVMRSWRLAAKPMASRRTTLSAPRPAMVIATTTPPGSTRWAASGSSARWTKGCAWA